MMPTYVVWAEKFIGCLWCNVRIWPKHGLFSTQSPLRSTHFFHRCCRARTIPMYRNSHLDPQKRAQLQIWPHHRPDTASQPSVFLCWGIWNRWCQIRIIWRVINQFKATVTRSSHCNHRFVCRSIVLVEQDSFRQFSRPSQMSLSTTFQSP